MHDQFDERWLADPEVFRINQLPAHSDHRFYENEVVYGADMSLRLSLDGQWDFAFAENVEEMKGILRNLGICAEAPAEGDPASESGQAASAEGDLINMGKIQVPGCIEMQGYGQIQYINTFYPWDGLEGIRPPMVPDHNPCGVYCKDLVIPENFMGRRLILTFEAASAALALYVNGRFVGYAEDSFTPSEFDVTEFAAASKAIRICAVVFKGSSASWIEDQDFFRFSGLFRSVYLTAIPRVHVEDIRVRTDLSKD
ncbi:MAG: beta-galactosidase, partial [Lachnospiraceae bacterium]|nr:beta-galactosidase [Lachnospiraceae bacterium]